MSDNFILAKKVKINIGATGINAVNAINEMDAEKKEEFMGLLNKVYDEIIKVYDAFKESYSAQPEKFNKQLFLSKLNEYQRKKEVKEFNTKADKNNILDTVQYLPHHAKNKFRDEDDIEFAFTTIKESIKVLKYVKKNVK